MASLTVLKTGLAGADPTYVAADVAGDTFANDGNTLFHVKNGSGGPLVVTVAAASPCNHGFEHDVVVSVPATDERIIGPFPVQRFGRTVSVTYSGVTTLTVAAIQPAV